MTALTRGIRFHELTAELVENKGVDLMNMSPTLKDEYLGAVIVAYQELWNSMAQELSAPGGCMHRDEVFDLCSDRISDVDLSHAIVWWRLMRPDQRLLFLSEIFPCEYYEVGDNEGFGDDGACW